MKREDEIARVTLTGSVVNLLLVGLKAVAGVAGHSAAMNEVYASFFTAPFPARSAVAVKTLPKGALVEIECIATSFTA